MLVKQFVQLNIKKRYQFYELMNQHYKWTFVVNNSPFAGREGKYVTSRKIEERLRAQLQTDVCFTC